MTFGAKLLANFVVGLDPGDVLFFVAIKTELARTFREQRFIRRLMGIMTHGTFAIAGRVVFEGCFRESGLKILMTIKTQFTGGFAEQFFYFGQCLRADRKCWPEARANNFSLESGKSSMVPG